MDLKAIKASEAVLRQAYLDAGGKPNSVDPKHNPCPLCQDATGFSIFMDEKGAARWKCHAKCGGDGGTVIDLVMKWRGCTSKEAVKFIGEHYAGEARGSARSLAPGPSPARGEGSRAAPAAPSAKKSDDSGKYFPDGIQVTEFWKGVFARQQGKLEFEWIYEDAQGVPAIKIVRIRLPNGKKEIRPNRRVPTGWRLGLGNYGTPERLLPLYQLPKLLKAVRHGAKGVERPTLHVAEGEKCADGLKALGLLSTTSCMGSSNAALSDWTPAVRFERIVIWPDVDAWRGRCVHCRKVTPCDAEACELCKKPLGPEERAKMRATATNAGEKYVETVVAKILEACAAAGSPVPQILVVGLREYGLQNGQDVWDLIEQIRGEGKEDAEIRAAVEAVAERYARPWAPARSGSFNGQPPPLAHDWDHYPDDAARPELRNFWGKWVKRKVKETKLNEATQKLEEVEVERPFLERYALPPWKIVAQVGDVLKRSLCRIRSQGAREPLLFMEVYKAPAEAAAEAAAPEAYPRKTVVDENDFEFGRSQSGGQSEGRLAWCQNSTQFKALLHRAGKLQYWDKRDAEGTLFLQPVDVFHASAEDSGVREYEAIQVRPHEPPIPGHYYAWRYPSGYRADGRKLAELLRFFENYKTPKDLGLICAAMLSPGWGGTDAKRYGCRPMIVINAADQGSGKTTIAQVAGDLWGGWMPLQLKDRAEDEFMKRALSPGGLPTRVVIIDNVTGVLKSGFIAGLITSDILRGHRMYQGDAMRPNDLTWIATLNNARLDRDMAQRSFTIELNKPTYSADWTKRIAMFVAKNGPEIVADCLEVLGRPKPVASLGLSDRSSFWCEEVFARGCAFVTEALGVRIDVREALLLNDAFRASCDVEVEEAEEFWEGVLNRVCSKYIDVVVGFGNVATTQYNWQRINLKKDIFIPAEDHTGVKPTWGMSQWAQEIRNRKELNTTWVRHFVESNHAAGRLKHVWYVRKPARGYRVAVAEVVAELKRREAESKRLEDEPGAEGAMAQM